MSTRILVINTGSTTTKIAVYDDRSIVFIQSISHDRKEIEKYPRIADQYEMQRNLILEKLYEESILPSSINIIVSRGGLLPLVESGAYEINEEMVNQLRFHSQNDHAPHLGVRIAYHFANEWNIKAYVYDLVTIDELIPITRITGLKEMKRKCMGNNLNMRAPAIKFAEKWGIPYQSINVIVAHLGKEITMSLHQNGKMIDMISDDEGPSSTERAGGLKSLLGTTDVLEVENMIQSGNEEAKLVFQAMALNIAKHIAKLSVVVSGQLEAIILTGGMAKSEMLTNWIIDYVRFIAPVEIFPGDHEMEALAIGALQVANRVEEAKTFITPLLVGV